MPSQQIKRMDIKEFREVGYLQEVNRQFFHPLGLALEVIVNDETGEETLGGVWDFRDDPEGLRFAKGEIDPAKVERVARLRDEKVRDRIAKLGFAIQPIS